MSNFNRRDIQKYEQMARKAIKNVPQFSRLSSMMAKINKKHFVFLLFISGLSYIAYKTYDYNKYKSQHYIDIFEWKKVIASKTRWSDLKEKIKFLSLEKNRQYATNKYQQMLKEQFNELLSKIKTQSIRNEEINIDYQKNKDNSKNENKNKKKKNSKQLILSTNYKSKLDFGYLFKLHTKQYVTTLTNYGEILQKTYIVPIMLFNVPFFYKKKQQSKTISKNKNKSYGNIIANKGKYKLSSECENINYWNILKQKKKQDKINKQNDENSIQELKQENTQDSNSKWLNQQQKMEKKQKEEKKKQNICQKQRKQKRQLLFECRNKIKKVQQQLIRQLKITIDQNWNKNKKHQNLFNYNEGNSFSIYQNKQQRRK